MAKPKPRPPLHPTLVQVLEPDEEVHAAARAADAVLAVSDRRLLVAAGERLALSLPIAELRRVQFDIEKGRPATLVIVPEAATVEPQVLAIPAEQLEAAAQALALVGKRLASMPFDYRESANR
ncbi:MAG TPA: hypothetical protein VIK06_05990 [Candidatus Limnocylindrales bacterium]